MKIGLDILLVEDEGPKRNHLSALLCEHWPDAELRIAKSVRTALEAVRLRVPHLILLDMSLSTFDMSVGEPGGRPQGFGGKEVLRLLDRLEAKVPVIVVTAYEAFSDQGKTIPLLELSETLRRDHPTCYRDIVYFNSVFGSWRNELVEKIEAVLSETGDGP